MTATVLPGHLPPFFETTFGGRLWATGDQPRSAHRQLPPANGQRRDTSERAGRFSSCRVRARPTTSASSPLPRRKWERRPVTPPRPPFETPRGRGAMGAFGGGALALLACMLQGSSWMLFFAVPSEGVGVPAVPPGFVTLDYPPSDFQRPEVPPPPRPPSPPPATRAHLTRACVFARAARSTCPATPSPASSASP